MKKEALVAIMATTLLVLSLLSPVTGVVSISYAADSGGDSVSISESYDVDETVTINETPDISFVDQGRTAEGTGEADLEQTITGKTMEGANYVAESDIKSNGTIDAGEMSTAQEAEGDGNASAAQETEEDAEPGHADSTEATIDDEVDNPTEAQIKAAIDKGIAWLVNQQNPEDGSWGTGSYGLVGTTSLVVKKLEHHAVDTKYGYGLDSPFNPTYPYRDNVSKGLDYLFLHAHTIAIGPQTYCPNPDTNNDGIGVYFVDGDDPKHRCYETGIALMAIAESIEQNKTVNVSNSEVNGWTYHKVAENAMNYLAWAQAETNGEGGWGYAECNNGDWNITSPFDKSDNSITGWVLIGLQYAELPKNPKCPEQAGFGLTIPPCVKDELKLWIEYIQCNPGDPGYTANLDGGSGYDSPCYWVNILKTGNLLKEMAFVDYPETHPSVIRASDFICRHWNDPDDGDWPGQHGWRGAPGKNASQHTMYATMKGFMSFDIHETCGIDWQADFEEVLVAQQNPNGSWPQSDRWCDTELIRPTVWALLTLEKVAPKERYDPKESFEDLLKSQAELLFSFEDLLKRTWDELSPPRQLGFLESFEDLLKGQEELIKSFEDLLNEEWDKLGQEDQIRYLRSFEDLLKSQEELLFSFEDLLKRIDRDWVDDPHYNLKESFEDLLKSQAELLFSFEDLLKRTWDELSPSEQLEFLESFEDLLKSQEKLIKSFEDLLNMGWDKMGREDQIRYLRSFEELLKSQEELLFSFEDLLKRIEEDGLG